MMSTDNEKFLRDLVGNIEGPLNYAANELWRARQILDALIELDSQWDHKRFIELVESARVLRKSKPEASFKVA
jgi:hypothetical protein